MTVCRSALDISELIGASTGKRNDDEDAKEKLYTYASHVIVESFKVHITAYSQFVRH